MSEDKVKGVMLIDLVRIVRANKELPWDEYLTKDEMDLIQGKIMPSTWYPFEVFEHIGYAVFMLEGGQDVKNSWNFGRFTIEDTFQKVYSNVLFKEKDPLSVIKRFVTLRKQFFRYEDPGFESMNMESLGDNKVRIIIRTSFASKPRKVAEDIKSYSGKLSASFANQLAGSFQRLLEIAGARDIKVEVIKIQSDPDSATELEIAWQ
jgi:hypothetical protein